MGSKKRKMLIGGVVSVGVIGAAAGSFLLVNKARKTYRAKQEMLKAQKELKDWANNAKLLDKKYYTDIANDVNSLNKEVDEQDENYLATAKKVKSKTKELKNELVETDQINEKTLQEIQVFDEKLNQFIDKYKLIAPKKIAYFKDEQNKLKKQYDESLNKGDLKATKARAEELIKLLNQSIVLADQIVVSKELLNRLPDTFELKNKLGNEITKAKEVLENPASTQEKINRAKEELARIYDEVNNAWSNTSDGIQQNIKNNIDKANEYHNKELKDPKYDKIAEDLAKKIKEIEDKVKNTTDVDELKGLEKEANQALEDAKKTKELIDKLSLEVQKAEKIKEEINKNPDLYDQDLKNNLDKAIDEAKKALDQIDNNKIIEANKNLSDEAKKAEDAIAQKKRKIIDEITNLKTEIENKKQQLSAINDNQIGKGAERYKNLIADIEKKIQDFETNTSDKLNEFDNAKLNEINQDLKTFKETIETKKEAIDNEFKTKFEELDKLKTQANEALKSMPTENEYEPNKKEVQELVTKANDIHNYDSKDELDTLIKEFEEKLKSAKTKYEAVNNEKKAVIDQIKQEIPSVKDFINKYEAEYPDLVADLKTALAEVSDDKAPSINNTKADLESKLNDLKTKLAQAKENLAKQQTQSLNQSLEALKKIKDSLTSNDESMKKLKTETEALINETQTIIDGSDTEAKKTQKTKVDAFREKAREEISEFKKRLDKAWVEHDEQVKVAKSVLYFLKNTDIKDSYTEIISTLEQAINTNETISDNDPIAEITKKTNDLKSAVEKAKKDEKLATTKFLINKLIDELPYPNNGENEAISKATKEQLKTKFASSITESTTEETIKQYKQTLEDLKNDLQSATSTINTFDEGDAKNNLLKSLASKDDTNIKDFITNEINKYDEAYKLIEKIEHVKKENASEKEKEHIALVNNKIDDLKNSLKTKVNKTTQVADLQNIVELIKKDTEIVNRLKTTFSGDILIAKNLTEELETKNDVADAEQVESKISGIKKELDRFWADDENSGKYIEKNSSLDYPKNGKANLKSFDEFLNNTVRSVKSEQELKDINDKIVPLYIKAIDFAKKANQIDEDIMPKSVKDALANELVKYDKPEDMAKIINYVEKDNSKYLKAYNKLNTIGIDKNRAKLLMELKGVATEPTANDVLKNINDVSDKIDKFAEKYEATKSALDSYDNNDYKYEKQLGRLKGRLDGAQDSRTLDNLKADIEKANALANSKKALVATLNEIGYSESSPAKVTLLNAIKDIRDENDIEPMRAKLNNLKTAMKRAKDDLAMLEYPSALNNEKDPKKIISNLLDNATEVDEINRILPPSWKEDIKKYKEMINGLPQDKQNGLTSRLNQTYPSSNEQNSKVSELHHQIIDTYKVDIKNKIDSYNGQGLISDQKPLIKAEVDQINYQNGDTIKVVEQKVEQIKAKYEKTSKLGWEKISAKAKLDDLDYPSKKNSQAYKNLLDKLKSAENLSKSEELNKKFENMSPIILDIKFKTNLVKDEEEKRKFIMRWDEADSIDKLIALADDLQKEIEKGFSMAPVKEEAKNEIDKINNKYPEKQQLNDLLETATEIEQVAKIKNEAQLFEQKNKLIEREKKLFKLDLSGDRGGLKRWYDKALKGDDNYYALDRLEGLIRDANSVEQLNTIEAQIKRHEDAILNDLKKEAHDGNIDDKPGTHQSLIKTPMIQKLERKDGTQFKGVDDDLGTSGIPEKWFNLKQKIRKENTVSSLEEWKAVEKEYNDFVAKYYDADKTENEGKRRWTKPVVARVTTLGKRSTPNTSFSTEVPDDIINYFLDRISKAQNEDEAKKIEKELMQSFYYLTKRNAQLVYDYNGFIEKVYQVLNINERSVEGERIRRNRSDFIKANTLYAKKAIAEQLIILTHNHPMVKQKVNQMFNIELLSWIVNRAAESNYPEHDRYDIIEYFAVGIDSFESIIKAKKNVETHENGKWKDFFTKDIKPEDLDALTGLPKRFIRDEDRQQWQEAVNNANS
ncbi:hypothetical protein [Mycoplasmopsis opalescens]|uniref:hypothetical protein n=1 Tax=Mycoplasmopsis opalescens TaxID=114886 RepID=UPI0004A711F9|nr:hypothetical protein [Mycoplasmopsis opalescens]